MPLIGYGGPAVPDGDPAVTAALLQALRAEAEARGADVLSVGASPLLSVETEALYRRAIGATHELENFVQLHDLRVHPLEQLGGKRRGAIRSELGGAARRGLTVVRGLDAGQLARWIAIYRERYEEIGASPYPEAFYERAFALAVPAGAVEFWGVVEPEGGTLVGGVMFLLSAEVVDYFSSAFLSGYRHLFPNTYLLNEAFAAFIERRIRWFNWQSSPGRGGVYRYKARWGATERAHRYLSVLLRPDTGLLRASVADVRRAYPLRFVLPFSLWEGVPAGAGGGHD
jgi:hypothetical protein